MYTVLLAELECNKGIVEYMMHVFLKLVHWFNHVIANGSGKQKNILEWNPFVFY